MLGRLARQWPSSCGQAIGPDRLAVFVGLEMEQHHDGEHLPEGELARPAPLTAGGEQVVLLPVLEELGKDIKTSRQQNRGTVKCFMRGPSPCVNDTDTESDQARFRRKIPLFPIGTWGHCFPLGWGNPGGVGEHSPPQAFSSWRGSHRCGWPLL